VTYSLVAFDPDSGECGVAVQSHWFSVGGLVSWAEPGVGAVATQSVIEMSYGPDGLALMRAGRSAPEALAELIRADELAASRQVAMVDAHGGVAAHTGNGCMPFAGQVVDHHHSAQANLMKTDAVWGAMSEAYLGGSGPLADRLLAALDAGEAAGGDVRGRQSAALLVVPAEGEPWRRTVDLRVEDHVEPLLELRRLVGLNEAYVMVREGDELAAKGDHVAAATIYIDAWERVPENDELKFWAALSMFDRGEAERGAALLREAIEFHPGWGRLLELLGPDIAPSVEEARRLLGQGPGGADPERVA
jgi:uncharacterized Ntn-hydrolase superfamily protein